jgi:hypothetical protein
MGAFRHNAVRLQLHALAYNLSNFMRTLVWLKQVEHWSLTTIREKLVKIGANVVAHGRYVTFQMAKVGVPRRTRPVRPIRPCQGWRTIDGSPIRPVRLSSGQMLGAIWEMLAYSSIRRML